MNKWKLFLAVLIGVVIGASSVKYYDLASRRRINKVVAQVSASVRNTTPSVVKKDLVISKESSRRHYVADVCLVWCFDNRFSSLRAEFIRMKGYKEVDPVTVAGGSRDILSSDGYVISQIRTSYALHHTKEVVLMLHTGCGGYDGNEDPSFYIEELLIMKEVVTELLKDLEHPPKITLVLAQFDGLYEIN